MERRLLGTTPLERVPLDQGSYLLTLRSRGKRDTRYPVFIPRGRRWDSGPTAVPLYSDAEIGRGFVYVPSGPFVCRDDDLWPDSMPRTEPWVEGFFLSVFPATMQDYCDFINGLAETDRDQAWFRVPRQEAGLRPNSRQYWDRPGPGEPFVVPEVDRDGDRWEPDWPVSAVSWNDAQACIAWRSQRDGVDWSLPTELQWEKAARGVDARAFPWGDCFDPTLCKMRSSRPGRPQPERVGEFAADTSPYGGADLAGSMREWCGDAIYDGNPKRRPVRGGAWHTNARRCRAVIRNGNEPWLVSANHGFRLARQAPIQTATAATSAGP